MEKAETRANRTITVDFQNEATYFQLLGDRKAFVEGVLAFLLALGFQLLHKATCRGGGCLTRHSHYARSRLVKKFKRTILMVLTASAAGMLSSLTLENRPTVCRRADR